MAVNIDLSGLKSIIKNVENVQKSMDVIGTKVLELNENQIAKQQDRHGKRFKRYTEGWVKERKRLGLTPLRKVDLTITGQMLQDFGIVSSGRGKVTIGFTATASKEKALSVYENGREFVGLSNKNRKKLFKFISDKYFK